jgi:polysaccharide export outer membrane protein
MGRRITGFRQALRHGFDACGLSLCVPLLCLAFAACTAPVDMPPVPRLASPEPGLVDRLPSYRLQVGDVVDLKFPLNPELNEQITVRPDGMISTAFTEDVPAFGVTMSELTADLRERYKKDLVNPRMSAILRSFAPNRVYVAGEVPSPGEFITVGPNLTVSQAIARAGGVKFSANREKVFIIRRGPHDEPQTYSVDYLGVIRGTDPQADIRLAQYDVVYVSRTGIGDAYQIVNQYLLQFIPVSVGLAGTP